MSQEKPFCAAEKKIDERSFVLRGGSRKNHNTNGCLNRGKLVNELQPWF
jgi:hypothetical protein